MTSAPRQITFPLSRGQRLVQLVDRLGHARVGVIGDLVCDVYVAGVTERVSREAPVLVVKQEDEWVVPGGAANTAVNVASLGASVELVGIVGDDDTASQLERELAKAEVGIKGLVRGVGRRTISKTRFLAGARHTSRQQVLRLDRHPVDRPDDGLLGRLLETMRGVSSRVDAWIVNDYGYESFNQPLREALADVAREKPVIVDSRFNLLAFSDVTLVKPNEEEAYAATGAGDIPQAAQELLDRMSASAVLVTLGNQGMFLHQRESSERIPASGTDEIVDLTGAGDTVASLLGAALACSADLSDAAHLANVAGGLVVMKEGPASVQPDELKEALLRRE